MNRREYLRSTAGLTAVGTVGLTGCMGGSGGTGTLATHVSDQPGDIGDFESLVVTVSEVRIQPADGELIAESVDDVTADLTKLQGDKQKLVAQSELEPGDYEYVHLGISNVEGTLADGSETSVDTAGEAGLKFQTFVVDGEESETFEIRSEETASFTADFTPVKQGGSGSYVLKPVADEVIVTYEDVEATTSA
ncbi:DUF4382 domain-containing protein [Halobaculum rubrum]|uniref:DUF4382 domain-containing protein n=1 Tax=Halobaculum rubrum TaxID=2872158 RepID=UPI001CECB7C9|nr:DUF4382 domain-containing protein [Halobaculum rubrum]